MYARIRIFSRISSTLPGSAILLSAFILLQSAYAGIRIIVLFVKVLRAEFIIMHIAMWESPTKRLVRFCNDRHQKQHPMPKMLLDESSDDFVTALM